jgi:hypothetical protein
MELAVKVQKDEFKVSENVKQKFYFKKGLGLQEFLNVTEYFTVDRDASPIKEYSIVQQGTSLSLNSTSFMLSVDKSSQSQNVSILATNNYDTKIQTEL